ncbi:MAG: type II toxin-antitoxin system RelE/ParE family toxin [Pirellulales bacterium]|nr:type II toxin-antitoxin system RelE/ParE family toxin [Pirellulales bacterium]
MLCRSRQAGSGGAICAGVTNRCKAIRRNPFLGEDGSLLRPRLRRVTYRGYLIFHRVNEQTFDVIRVLHGARDWSQLL